MSSAMDLTNSAVSKKREGKFKEAIQFYEKALQIDNQSSIIYTSLAKSLYLDNQRDSSINNYIIGLSLSIIDYANQNGYKKSDIKNEHVRNNLVSSFFSTNGHLAHAYIDLDKNEIENLIDNITQAEPSLNKTQIQQIVNYEISNYRFGLAGGGLKNEPNYHNIDHDLAFLEIYKNYGERIAMHFINWDTISNLLN